MASVLTGASYLGVAPTNTTATFSFGGLTFGAKYALRYYYKQWVVDSPFRMVQFTFNGDGTNAVFQTDEDIGGEGPITSSMTSLPRRCRFPAIDG